MHLFRRPWAGSRPAAFRRGLEIPGIRWQANKQTAAELGISAKTVEKHREKLMSKLNIHDTAGLTRYAISTGVVESSVQLNNG